jgi:hypothetical protein
MMVINLVIIRLARTIQTIRNKRGRPPQLTQNTDIASRGGVSILMVYYRILLIGIPL